MTELERDRLMQFLQALKQTRLPHDDKWVETVINEGVDTQPRATYLLVHRCRVLQAELDHARGVVASAGLASNSRNTLVWEFGETV